MTSARLQNIHVCSIEVLNHDHRQASTFVVGQLIKDKFGVGRVEKSHNIIEDISQEYGVNISYDKSWLARKLLSGLRGGLPRNRMLFCMPMAKLKD